MNETPTFKRWSFFFFLLLISLFLLPKAGKDFLKSSLRIKLEQQKQAGLQLALAQLNSGDKLERAEIKRQMKGNVYMIGLQKEIRGRTIVLLSIYFMSLAGLAWVWFNKKLEGSEKLVKV